MDQWTRFAHTKTHTTERTALADGRETLHFTVFSAKVLHVESGVKCTCTFNIH